MSNWQDTIGASRASFPWASGFDEPTWQAFVAELAAYLEPRGRPVKVQAPSVITARADGVAVELSLQTLGARCLRARRPVWPTLVNEHLGAILAPPDLPAGYTYGDFDQARERLKMRLCSEGELAASDALPRIRLDPAPGLSAVLSYDTPGGACDVPPEDFGRWGHPEASLYATGLSNLRRVPDVPREQRELPCGATMHMLRSDSAFGAAQLLVLERFLVSPAPYGALACVPKTDLLLFHLIEDARVRQAAEELGKLSAMLHQRGPAPLSPFLYWFRKGALMHLPMEVSSQGVVFKAPASFTARVLAPLGA